MQTNLLTLIRIAYKNIRDMTDIDAREFKEFDDELDVDIMKIEKNDLIFLL
ncbi:hypothetical protein ACQKOA_24775 [Bacillus mobilis]|uniref:hypothetical protein n=1 Tax=Bacillus mobilis TaxID=2026190 RepID=UPI003D01BB93